jgi:hypothetical protein
MKQLIERSDLQKERALLTQLKTMYQERVENLDKRIREIDETTN